MAKLLSVGTVPHTAVLRMSNAKRLDMRGLPDAHVTGMRDCRLVLLRRLSRVNAVSACACVYTKRVRK